jgi:hypothetical protein
MNAVANPGQLPDLGFRKPLRALRLRTRCVLLNHTAELSNGRHSSYGFFHSFKFIPSLSPFEIDPPPHLSLLPMSTGRLGRLLKATSGPRSAAEVSDSLIRPKAVLTLIKF